jgi:hypothetical protein
VNFPQLQGLYNAFTLFFTQESAVFILYVFNEVSVPHSARIAANIWRICEL